MAEKILELEKEMARPDFWQDNERASEVQREISEIRDEIDKYKERERV